MATHEVASGKEIKMPQLCKFEIERSFSLFSLGCRMDKPYRFHKTNIAYTF